MNFISKNIAWMVPTVAIVGVAMTSLTARDDGGSIFAREQQKPESRISRREQQRAATASVGTVAPAQTAAVTSTPQPAAPAAAPTPTPDAGPTEGQQVIAMLQTVVGNTEAGSDEAMEVSRSEPLDLLQTATASAPKPEPVPQVQAEPVKPFDAEASANFFATAQADLALNASCGEDLKALAATARIYFPSGGVSGEETGLARARLIGQIAKDCPGYTIQVEGHSDRSGDRLTNLRLSERRAAAIVSRLGASGIDTTNFVSVGYGDARPSGTQGPEESAYYDRRVEFSVIDNTQQASLSNTTTLVRQQQPATQNCAQVLEAKVNGTHLFYAPRAITVSPTEMEAVHDLARAAMSCEGVRLRMVGQHSDEPGTREDVGTGRLRVLALLSTLVATGIDRDKILIGAPSTSQGVPGQAGLPNSRVDFQIIME